MTCSFTVRVDNISTEQLLWSYGWPDLILIMCFTYHTCLPHIKIRHMAMCERQQLSQI